MGAVVAKDELEARKLADESSETPAELPEASGPGARSGAAILSNL